jgi:hypothetical protein
MEERPLKIDPVKSWWAGDPRVDPFMSPVREAIGRYIRWPSPQFTDIYNRAYEAVYKAILEYSKERPEHQIPEQGEKAPDPSRSKRRRRRSSK